MSAQSRAKTSVAHLVLAVASPPILAGLIHICTFRTRVCAYLLSFIYPLVRAHARTGTSLLYVRSCTCVLVCGSACMRASTALSANVPLLVSSGAVVLLPVLHHDSAHHTVVINRCDGALGTVVAVICVYSFVRVMDFLANLHKESSQTTGAVHRMHSFLVTVGTFLDAKSPFATWH